MLIDAHAHIDRFDMVDQGAKDAALAEITEHGILTISNSMDIPSYEENLALSEKCKWILPIFGIHPWNAGQYHDKLETLDRYINQSPMLGELGLDHFFVEDNAEYPHQITVFEYFLAAAKAQNKIVHLHTKGAEEAVYDLLVRYSLKRILIHWYSGPIETLQKFIDLGAYFTVGIEVKFSEHLKRIAELIPLNRLLTETDNPGGPKSFLDRPGTPVLIYEVIKTLSKVKEISEGEIISRVSSNLLDLIDHDPRLKNVRVMLQANNSIDRNSRMTT